VLFSLILNLTLSSLRQLDVVKVVGGLQRRCSACSVKFSPLECLLAEAASSHFKLTFFEACYASEDVIEMVMCV